MRQKRITAFFCALLLLMLTACGAGAGKGETEKSTNISDSLTWKSAMELQYADKFAVDYYEGGYGLISLQDGGRFLVVPEGKEAPEDLPEDIVPIFQPVENIYLVASAVMDMFVSLDALYTVRFSGLKQDSWYIEEAKAAMEEIGRAHV